MLNGCSNHTHHSKQTTFITNPSIFAVNKTINSRSPVLVGDSKSFPLNRLTFLKLGSNSNGDLTMSERKNYDDCLLQFSQENHLLEKEINLLSADGTKSENKEEKQRMLRKLSIEFMSQLYRKGVASKDSSDLDFIDSKDYKISGSYQLDENNPYVYSYTKLHPFSFFFGTKGHVFNIKSNRLLIPAPALIKSEDWDIQVSMAKDDYMKEQGSAISDKYGIVLVDEKIMRNFRGIVRNMIKQVLLAALGNKISLPVKLFEPKALVERMHLVFSFADQILLKASSIKYDPLERFKLVISFVFGGMYLPSGQMKPFNPILGETYQSELSNGGWVYTEIISTRPILARILIINNNYYRLSGFLEFSVRPENFGSCINVFEKGPLTVTFPLINEEITFGVPHIKIINAKSEHNRGCLWHGASVFVDVKNSWKCIIKFNENPKIVHEIEGNILKYKFPKDYKFDYQTEFDNGKKYKINNKVDKIISKLTGSWLDKLLINGEQFWSIDVNVPDCMRPVKNCIPSDCRFREDVIWLFRSFYCNTNENERAMYESFAQEYKIMIEKFQRVERSIRDKYHKNNK